MNKNYWKEYEKWEKREKRTRIFLALLCGLCLAQSVLIFWMLYGTA